MIDPEVVRRAGTRLSTRRENLYLYGGMIYKLCRADQDFAYTYLNELHWLETLDLPFLPRLIDRRVDADWVVMVMERVRGEPLSARHRRMQRTVLRQVEAMGRAGVVHRDLMPGNILVRPGLLGGAVHFVDLQFMRALDREMDAPPGSDLDARLRRVGVPYRPAEGTPLAGYDVALLTHVFRDLFGRRSIL